MVPLRKGGICRLSPFLYGDLAGSNRTLNLTELILSVISHLRGLSIYCQGGDEMDDFIEKRKRQRRNAGWPITLMTTRGPIAGETRNITSVGVFISCEKEVPKTESYRMLIRPPLRKPIEVKANLIWSNLHDAHQRESTFSEGMGFCFVGLSDEDRRLLDELISVDSILE